jgi:site-specific DNA recombinase
LDLKNLKKRFVMEADIDKEIYFELKKELEGKISAISQKILNDINKISNLENYLQFSEQIVKNISKYWGSEGLGTKKKIQELVFPDGLLLDTKNRTYLTPKVNNLFKHSYELIRVAEDSKGNGIRKNLMPSSNVPRTGIEPVIHP